MRCRTAFLLGLAAILLVKVVLAATARDAHSESSGSPGTWDPDLSTPFSISGQVFGFPGSVIADIDSFTITIGQVSNPTGAGITAQVYFAATTITAPDGTHLLLPGATGANPSVAINGCTITVAAGFSGPITQSCNLNSDDDNTLQSLNIFNPNSTSQNMNLGLGPEARNLVFDNSGSQQVSLTVSGPDPSVSCNSARFSFTPAFLIAVDVNAPAPPVQTCSISTYPSQTVSAAVSTALGGTWLSASIDYSDNLEVAIDPAGLAIGMYTGSVTLTTNANLTLTLPVSLTILPQSPQLVQQQPKLTQSSSTHLGTSVALAGNWPLVGSPGEKVGTNYGGAWYYDNSGRTWTPYGDYTFTSTGQAMEGTSVAVSASQIGYFLVGGPGDNGGVGAAWVFQDAFPATKLIGSNAIGKSNQGISAALSNDANTALVGGNLDNNGAGAAWVFSDSQNTWSQQKLVAADAIGPAYQGSAVALSDDGNTALVGGNGDNGGAGAAWVFVRSNGSWSEQAKLVGSGASGAASQGASVALSGNGDTAIIGGPMDSNSMGAAWIFTRSGTSWTQIPQGKLVGAGGAGSHVYQGSSVALSDDGKTAAIGGNGDNNSVGAAWVFQLVGTVWTPFDGKVTANDSVGAAQQGPVALSTDGSVLLLGGPGDNSGAGASWHFTLSIPAPVLTGISPNSALVAGSGFTLMVNGQNFQNGAVVVWNNDVLPTTFVSSTQLTASVSSYEIDVTGTAAVYVANPDGGLTAAATFTTEGPSLSGGSTHIGNFVLGQNGALYTIMVANAAGALATTATVSVTDTLPGGLTAVSMSGSGWACTLSSTTCTRSDSLAGGRSYPSISLRVNVAADASTPVYNLVGVTGGGPGGGVYAYDPTGIVSVSACDINGDKSTDLRDVQAIVNQALGKATPVNDLSHDGRVDLGDVQLVVNAVLGWGCGAH